MLRKLEQESGIVKIATVLINTAYKAFKFTKNLNNNCILEK